MYSCWQPDSKETIVKEHVPECMETRKYKHQHHKQRKAAPPTKSLLFVIKPSMSGQHMADIEQEISITTPATHIPHHCAAWMNGELYCMARTKEMKAQFLSNVKKECQHMQNSIPAPSVFD